MIRRFSIIVSISLSLLLLVPVGAQQTPPELPVRGYILQDFYSGQVLAERNANQRMEPASITKLMSAYIVYKQLGDGKIGLADQVTISTNAQSTEGSRMFIEQNTRVSIEELLMGVVVQSGNDAAVALAEHIAGSEAAFANMMNDAAADLGLRGSNFINSTGLPHPEHYTTARDIAVLVRAVIAEFPQQYAHYAVRSYTYNNIEQHNRNRLLWRDASVDGVKTGHTQSAGFCLTASALRGTMRLISVVLGSETDKGRFDASENLLNFGFRHYETFKLYPAGHVLTEAKVWQGKSSQLSLGFTDNIYLTIPKGRYADMQASLRVNSVIQAPVAKGASFGSVVIRLDDNDIANLSLFALNDVAKAGFFGRMTDSMLLMINSLFN